MKNITLDYSNIMGFIDSLEIEKMKDEWEGARDRILDRSGAGADFLGWVDLPEKTDKKLIDDIKHKAEEIRKDTDVFISIGIGGSYLGAKACIDALLPNFYNSFVTPQIFFSGISISARYLKDLMTIMDGKRVTLNVISKSGTTTEPAIAFRVLRDWMIRQYGIKEANRRIIATTDSSKGALKQMADREKIKTYVIPDDVGGRFSVLTPVGLLPIAVAGIDIQQLIDGAVDGSNQYKKERDPDRNPSLLYAVLRNILYRKGKTTEILSNFEPQLHYMAEWWKQLFGESEGKNNKGIFPSACDFTTDLHSMGQWIQEGRRDIMETFLHVVNPGESITVQKDEQDLDRLNYLAGRNLTYVNEQALWGTRQAHVDGGVPNMTINFPGFNPHCIGKLFYFFEWAVAISGYMLGVNPFDQPGVESYKKNMFALLGKPGYEQQTGKLASVLSSQQQYISGAMDVSTAGK